jgi:hypothetical protein
MDGYRPPIGFIVEGKMEYNCFLSLFSKLNTGCTGMIPEPLWANGNDSILCYLEEHLRDIARTESPISIIVCIDFREAHDKHGFTCNKLKKYLEDKASKWLKAKQVNQDKLPMNIIIIIVIQQFESWMLSDMRAIKTISGINDLGSFGLPDRWTNVDEEIPNHMPYI